MLDINQIKKEIDEDSLSSSEQKVLEMKVCRLYKDGTCQILRQKHKHNQIISIHEDEITWLKNQVTNIPPFPYGKGKIIRYFKGTVCADKEGCLCGFFPITSSSKRGWFKMEASLINPFNAGLYPSVEVNRPTKARREKEQQSLLDSEKRKNEAKGFFQMRGIPIPYFFWEYEMNKVRQAVTDL
jgi:hypothetical protein